MPYVLILRNIMIRNVETSPSAMTALTNCVYVSPDDDLSNNQFIEMNNYVFTVILCPGILNGNIGINNIQRKMLRVAVGNSIDVNIFTKYIQDIQDIKDINMISCEISNFSNTRTPISIELDTSYLTRQLVSVLQGQIIGSKQRITFDFQNRIYNMLVNTIIVNANNNEKEEASRGKLHEGTVFVFTSTTSNPVKII